MIWLDWPLGIVAILFFILSWLYKWGLLKWHRNDFAFDLVSTVGIMSIVSCCYTLVWLSRTFLGYAPIPDPWYPQQVPYDLAIIFFAALPGMTSLRIELQKDQKFLNDEITRLRNVILEQEDLLANSEKTVNEIITISDIPYRKKILDIVIQNQQYSGMDYRVN